MIKTIKSGKAINWTFSIFAVFVTLNSCAPKKRTIQLTQPNLILTISQDQGTNGSSVVYNPIKQVYYTCFAGNSRYPLETYNAKGEIVFIDKCGWDIRGMWYNPNNNYLEINGYDNTGIRTNLLDENGWASNTVYTLIAVGCQPTPNACPAYDPAENRLIFYDKGYLLTYNRTDLELIERILIELPCDTSRINSSTPIFTGIEGKELGILNYIDKEVYFFNEETGKLSATYILPKEVPTTKMLNFSYANGKLWFFNRNLRQWWGYNIETTE